MPRKIAQGITGEINGKLYVLTGSCEGCAERISRRLYRYDPATATLPWTPVGRLVLCSDLNYRGFSDGDPRFRRGFPPRNSKWPSLTTLAMETARPSQRTRANWRAESQAALYQTPGLSPG